MWYTGATQQCLIEVLLFVPQKEHLKLTPMRRGGDEETIKNVRRFQKQNSDNLGMHPSLLNKIRLYTA